MINAGDEGSDVSSGDVTIFKSPAETRAPLSEVGSPPTSARPSGSNIENNTSVSGVPAEFFAQMLQIMKHMSDRMTTQPDAKIKISDVFLPSYDPDSNIGIREWCQLVSTAMETYNLSDYEVRMKAGSLLKGRARLWVDNWLVSTATWSELREVLITTFEPENRYSRDVCRFREYTYDNSKDITQFLSQAWVLWRRVTKDKLTNDDAVEAVIGCIDDERLRIELLNARATSVPELISVASSIRCHKRPQTTDTHQTLVKRPRFNKPVMFCFICKKLGHDQQNCRYRDKTENASLHQQINKTMPQNPNKSTCTFCSKIGHTFETCYKRERAIVSKVNHVGISKLNSISVIIGNFNVNAIFDSGAECSVIRESISKKIPGKRIEAVRCLRGLGQFTVVSLLSLTTVCIINDLQIELQFHVVADFEIPSDILIGMNLVENTDLTVIVNAQGATLVRQPAVYHMRSNNEKFDKLDCDLTSDVQINELKILLNKFEHLFIYGYPSTRVNTGSLDIRLKDVNKCVERRPYRLSPIEREKVRSIINELLEHNIIRESKSPFSSPIILVKKKNGQDRMCVDYRELNRNTLRDNYPLPIISDQIDQLTGGLYFSTFDMAAGFHQIPIREDSIEKTAFVTPDGLFEYLTMPFGLSNAVSVYQRCINRALSHLLSSHVCQVYVDDVLSKCKDYTEGISRIERILTALQHSGFSININKCAFFKRSIEYLGNVIADGQVSPSSRKVEALTKAPIPKTVKQVRQFNGLAGYFRRFIPNFSRIMVPLYELTKNDAKWEWSDRHDKARNHIVQHLSTAPTLLLFQEDAPIELYTDASSIGYGAVLIQIIGGRQHPVAYMSQRTTDIESRYHSYELGTQKKITVVPKSFQWSLINSYHTALQHPGWEKTLQKVKETYWFDKMATTVRRFVDNCIVCKISKGPSGAVQAQLHPIQKPTAAFQVVHMDITGKLGTKTSHGCDEYVIVTIDAFTKYVLLDYSTDKTQSSTLAALKRLIHLFGTPSQVIVDGGREFLGEFKVYCDNFEIDVHSIAPGVSRANGQVERTMSTLKNALTMIKNFDTKDWHTALGALQLAFNCTPHRVTGVAPLSLLTRRQKCVPPELLRLVNIENESIDFDLLEQHVLQKMTAAAQYDKQRFDKNKAKVRPFQRGDYVLIRNNSRNQTSLDPKYSQPYEIYKILDNDRYMVKRVIGRGRPRKVAHDQLRRAPQPGEQETVSTTTENSQEEAQQHSTTEALQQPSTSV